MGKKPGGGRCKIAAKKGQKTFGKGTIKEHEQTKIRGCWVALTPRSGKNCPRKTRPEKRGSGGKKPRRKKGRDQIVPGQHPTVGGEKEGIPDKRKGAEKRRVPG